VVDGPNDGRAEELAAESSVSLAASVVAHEINNPLESLLNLLYLLEAEANISEKGRRYLNLAQTEVHRVAQITREALNHNGQPQKEITDVCALLASVLDFYKQKLESSGITIGSRYTCDGNIAVYTGQLRQMLSNLLLNASEATPQGGKIRVHLSACHERSGELRSGIQITVADSGCGIPASVLSQIFQKSFTMKPSGHGMGLAFVKNVVNKHDGVLRVRSNTRSGRQGTAFRVFLPVD